MSITGRNLVVAVLLVLVAAFYIATIRVGHQWGDDFALYLHHARNLIDGKPYTDVGLIDNPLKIPDLGPTFYPPGFAWMTAPVLKAYGLNFTALKIEVILSFVAALWLCFVLFRDRLPYWWTVALIALIGFNPGFWRYRNDIASDFPFLAVAYGGMWMIHTVYKRFKDQPPLWLALPFGACLYLAYAVRPHGVAMLAAFVFYELHRARKIRPILAVTTMVTVAGVAAQFAILGLDTRLRLFNLSPKWFVSSLIGNIRNYRAWWLTGYIPALSYLLFGLVLVITLYGLSLSIRSGVRVYDLFAILYMLVVIPYYLVFDRYLIPIVPVLLFYLLIGVYQIAKRMPATAPAVAAGLAAVLFSYGTIYAQADRGPILEGTFDPDFVALCRYVEANTAPGSRMIFRKPRLLTLITDRPSAIYHEPPEKSGLWDFMRSQAIAYVVVGDVPSPEFDSDRMYLRPFVAAYRDHFTSVYRNNHYELLRITP